MGKGGGGGGHPDSEIKGAPVSKRFFSRQFGLNIWGGGGVHTVELPPSRCPGEADKLYATVTSYLESCIKSESTLNKEKKDM